MPRLIRSDQRKPSPCSNFASPFACQTVNAQNHNQFTSLFLLQEFVIQMCQQQGMKPQNPQNPENNLQERKKSFQGKKEGQYFSIHLYNFSVQWTAVLWPLQCLFYLFKGRVEALSAKVLESLVDLKDFFSSLFFISKRELLVRATILSFSTEDLPTVVRGPQLE